MKMRRLLLATVVALGCFGAPTALFLIDRAGAVSPSATNPSKGFLSARKLSKRDLGNPGVAAITTVSIGTNTNTSGTTIAVTVGAGGVPATSMIFCAAFEFTNSTTIGTIADTASNTYTKIGATLLPNNTASAHGEGGIFYAYNVTALSNGNTITFTKNGGSVQAVFSCLYATGIKTVADPLDTAVSPTIAFGSSTTPSVTSGTPGVAGELFICALAFGDTTATPTFTQDTGNGWAVPPTEASVNNGGNGNQVNGGNQVNVGTGTKACAPTYSASKPWAITIAGFKPQ